MDIKFYLPNIRYTFESNIFIFEPIKFLYIEGKFPVFIYKIKYNENEGFLPLYMSDGKTNGFRCNLLLPFICFKTVNENDTCPLSEMTHSNGLVYKLKLCENYNVDEIKNMILTDSYKLEFIKNFYDITEEVAEKIKTNEINDLKVLGLDGKGLMTILDRINNFILLIINLLNKKIIELEKNKNVYDERFIIPTDNNDIIQYDILYHIENLSHREPIKKSYIYRLKLIEYLILMKNELIKESSDILYYNFIEKNFSELEKINYEDYNKYINICVDNSIRENYNDNFMLINKISNDFIDLYKINIPESIFIDDFRQNQCNLVDSFDLFHLTCNKNLKNIKSYFLKFSYLYNHLYEKYNTYFDSRQEFYKKIIFESNITNADKESIENITRKYNDLFLSLFTYIKNLKNININIEIDILLLDEYVNYILNYNEIPDDKNITKKHIENVESLLNEYYIKIEKKFEEIKNKIEQSNQVFKLKYLKYKNKYLKLKNNK